MSLVCHTEFRNFTAKCSVKITVVVDIENANKLFDKQILIFKGMK
jgi:hypothetical protein